MAPTNPALGRVLSDQEVLDAIRNPPDLRAVTTELQGLSDNELLGYVKNLQQFLGSDDEEREREAPRSLSDEEIARQVQTRTQLFHDGSKFKVTRRQEIVGIDNILGEIDEIIHWLVHAEEYGRYKSRLQPGVVFSGSPGTGKTLVSRWIATESGALFINVRDFVHDNALFTDTDIRDLFAHARATYADTQRPVVLFWDEFENSAVERSSESSTPEQKSVVSQLTSELDGIHGKNKGVLLIGCTNYPESIDTALLRRGRMGVQIEFHAPDRAGKEKILAYYLAQTVCTPEIDLNTLSYFFHKDSTAADIEEACVEAWRHAVRRAIDNVEEPRLRQKDLVQVFIKQLVGPPTTFTIPVEERLTLAVHECGHAIAALMFGIPLRLITVQPGKNALGRVMVDDLTEYTGTTTESLDYMRMLIGGLAAERTAGVGPMTGAVRDLDQLNQAADWLVGHLYEGERTGLMSYTALNRVVRYDAMSPQVSDDTIIRADKDVREIIELVQRDTYAALDRVGKENLYTIAKVVKDRVTMTGKEFRELFVEVCGFEPEPESQPELEPAN